MTVVTTAVLIGLGGVITFCVGTWLAMRRRDQTYDLEALRQVHDRDEIDRAYNEQIGPDEFDHVTCLSCGEEYDLKRSACPRCGRTSFNF